MNMIYFGIVYLMKEIQTNLILIKIKIFNKKVKIKVIIRILKFKMNKIMNKNSMRNIKSMF
jgi:hypothetical protein